MLKFYLIKIQEQDLDILNANDYLTKNIQRSIQLGMKPIQLMELVLKYYKKNYSPTKR
jgi:hypothetical protein